MSGLAAVLALAAQVVTLDAAVIAEKSVYVRVGVNTDSRIEIAEGMVRVHGQRATGEMLGLKLGYARPTTLLLLHPRSSGLGELKFVGLKHTLRLHIEASTLGTAQDLELRIAESDAKSAPPPAAGAAQPPKGSSVAPEAATGRATPARADGYPSPPNPRPSPSPSASPQKPTQPRLDGAPTPRRPRATSAAALRPARARGPVVPKPTPSSRDAASAEAASPGGAPTVAEPQPVVAAAPPAAVTPAAPVAQEAPAPSAGSATMPATCPSAPAPTTKRLMRRFGRPGQRGIVLEELRREGAQVTLRARVEGAADAQLVQLALGALDAKLTVDRAGRDLVLTGTVVAPLPLHNATLVLALTDHWESARFRLPRGGTS